MIWLALLIGFWAVYGTGKQVGHDARAGLGNARQRAAARSAAIRADKRAPKWKRRTVTATHYGGKMTGATFRGVRYAGRSAAKGAQWGIAEGRQRHAEREELRTAWARPDEGDGEALRAARQVRDRILHDRAERAGRAGIPARKARRIAKRDAAEDERIAVDKHTDDTADELREEREVEPWNVKPTFAELRAERDADPVEDPVLCDSCGNTTDRCICAEYGIDPTADEEFFALRDSGYDGPIDQDGNRVDDLDAWITRQTQPTSSNGGTATMTAPTSNSNGTSSSEPPKGWFDHIIDHGKAPGGYSGNGHSGEATTISGARAAWGSFQHDAVEMFDSATTAETEADARMAGAAALLDTAAAAETDAQTCSRRAEMLAASLVDGDMGDPQAIADAQQQQEFAVSLTNAAATLRAEAEASQAQAAKIKQLGGALRSAAEASQAHATQAVAGMNARMARREAFFKD